MFLITLDLIDLFNVIKDHETMNIMLDIQHYSLSQGNKLHIIFHLMLSYLAAGIFQRKKKLFEYVDKDQEERDFLAVLDDPRIVTKQKHFNFSNINSGKIPGFCNVKYFKKNN